MPNRRRRKLSTAMSAVAALAVASPCAYFLVYESTTETKPVEHHEFKQAAVMADLPNELMGALTQGLSQFGVNLPSVPSLNGGGASPGLTSPGLGAAGLGTPGLTSPGLGAGGLGTPGLTSPGLTPGATALPSTPGAGGLSGAGLTSPGLTPGVGGLTNPGLTNPGLTNPGLSNPGLSNPAAGLTPGLSPLGGAGEAPIGTPAGLDPGPDGTYPILGDPSTLGGAPGGGSGGLVNDVMQAANQLGASQAIDMIKGLVMPAITQSVQQGGGALPGAAGALPGAAAGAFPAAPPI